jgi:hypothetical protein
MVNVPHAFTPEYPADDETQSRPCKTPVILNDYDGYMFGAGGGYDLAIDVEDSFDRVCRMAWCHQSQITEWLPWVGRHDMDVPRSLDEFANTLRARFRRRNRELGIASERFVEVFTVTAWGEVPTYDQVVNDFPNVIPEASNLEGLKDRLDRWRAG